MTALTDLTDCVVDYTDENVLLGDGNGGSLTTGTGNTALGALCLTNVTSGTMNTAIGANTLNTITTTVENTAVGYGALDANTGNFSTAIGSRAMSGATGGNNTAIGRQALYVVTGLGNVAVGQNAGVQVSSGATNTLIGTLIANNLTTGSNNVIVGQNGGDTLISGSSNILIGTGIDVPADNTSNHLNIGGAITGNLSTGNITVTGDLAADNLSGTNTGDQTDATLSFTDITTNNVSSTKHGFAPKSPADATKFLNGAATPSYELVKDSDLSTSDVTTNNATTSKHGFLKKLSNSATQYMDGTGNWSTPAGANGRVVYSGTASASASLPFASVFTAGNNYMIQLINVIPATDAVGINLGLTRDNGTAWTPGLIDTIGQHQVGTTLTAISTQVAQVLNLTADLNNIGSNANEYGINGTIWLYNPASSIYRNCDIVMHWTDSSTVLRSYRATAQNIQTPALTGGRIIATSGNLESGTVVVREYPLS